MKVIYLIYTILIIQLAQTQPTQFLDNISKFNIDFTKTTISGLSSGGYMAVQLQVANSKFFQGIVAVGSGPYWNAKGQTEFGHKVCRVHPELIVLEDLIQYTKELSQKKLIDSVEYLKNTKAVIIACERDTTVVPEVTANLAQQYKILGSNVEHITVANCEHSYPTTHFGQADPLFKGSPFMNICNYDTAFKTFSALLGDKYIKDHKKMMEQNFFEFSQTKFTTKTTSMHQKGYLYVPTACQTGSKCVVHIAFHGCRQTPDHIGTIFARNTKLNDYAESNNVIILYPQAAINEELGNGNGCWDYWGYTGPNYVEKNGKQNTAVMKILYALQRENIQDEL